MGNWIKWELLGYFDGFVKVSDGVGLPMTSKFTTANNFTAANIAATKGRVKAYVSPLPEAAVTVYGWLITEAEGPWAYFVIGGRSRG